jgi:alpha-L-fucosidase
MVGRVGYAQLLHDGSEVRMQEGTHIGYQVEKDLASASTLTLLVPIQRPDVLVPVIELFLK